MKKCYIEVTEELIKKLFTIPDDAIITDIVKHPLVGCYKIYMSNYGYETLEGGVIQMKPFGVFV